MDAHYALLALPGNPSFEGCSPMGVRQNSSRQGGGATAWRWVEGSRAASAPGAARQKNCASDRKSTRLNSSHLGISYAVFCLKQNNKRLETIHLRVPRAAFREQEEHDGGA